MAEEVVSTATKISLFSAIIPHPGINIVKTWQGIMEIVLRAVVAVLAFVLIIPAATTQTQVSTALAVFTPSRDAGVLNQTTIAAGWLLFVAVITLLIEAAIIAIRFLNLGLIEKYTLPLVITDAVICLVVALGLFAGATPIAVYSGSTKALHSSVSSAAGATAAFGYFLLIAAVALGVWVMLAYFVLKWCTSGKYVVTSRSSDPEPSKPM